MKFGLIGDGYAAQRHKKAIEHVKGGLCWIFDPVKHPGLHPTCKVDYIVIASPNWLHYEQTINILRQTKSKIICEKPLCLPWEPVIDDDRINICLQLRYIEDLPKKADLVRVSMTRNKAFFDSWKGDPRLSGGNMYEFYIHYADLSILLNADFEGEVKEEGTQIREIHWIDNFGKHQILDIMGIDMQSLYNKMYEKIIAGEGIHPRDIFYLMWVLNRNSEIYGYRGAGISKQIKISKDLL